MIEYNKFMNNKTKENLIKLTQKEADKAIIKGNPPFGAVLTDRRGNVIVTAHNTQISSLDVTAHAEINLLRKVCKKLKTKNLSKYLLFSNAESCSMCASAAIKAGIRSIYYGAPHEPSMDPNISIFELAKRAKKKIYIHPNILKEECVTQIKKGRETISRSNRF